MNTQIFFKWLRINTSFFMGAFIISLLLAFVFPDTMLGFVRGWGAYGNDISLTVLEPTSRFNLFVNILIRNSFMTGLYFIASLLFLAPLIALMGGTFYSLGLVSAFERGVSPIWHPPILITVEVFFILLSISFGSALGTEIFGAKPGGREVMDFWRRNCMRLFPRQKRNWVAVFKENRKEIILFATTILALLLFGAGFEVLI